MAFLKLIVRHLGLPALVICAIGLVQPAAADPEPAAAALSLSLSAETALATMMFDDAPSGPSEPAQVSDTKPEPKRQTSSWWVWALLGVAAAGVGAVVLTSTGKDPACPAGRVCH
jgi:hypothetical protein